MSPEERIPEPNREFQLPPTLQNPPPLLGEASLSVVVLTAAALLFKTPTWLEEAGLTNATDFLIVQCKIPRLIKRLSEQSPRKPELHNQFCIIRNRCIDGDGRRAGH